MGFNDDIGKTLFTMSIFLTLVMIHNFIAVARWAHWGPYGSCQGKCGQGVQHRYRRCNIETRYTYVQSYGYNRYSPAPHSTRYCTGRKTSMKRCYLPPCYQRKSLSRPLKCDIMFYLGLLSLNGIYLNYILRLSYTFCKRKQWTIWFINGFI